VVRGGRHLHADDGARAAAQELTEFCLPRCGAMPCLVSPAQRCAALLQSTPELITQHWQLSYSLEDSSEDGGRDNNIVIDEPCLAWLWEIQDIPSLTGNFTLCHTLARL